MVLNGRCCFFSPSEHPLSSACQGQGVWFPDGWDIRACTHSLCILRCDLHGVERNAMTLLHGIPGCSPSPVTNRWAKPMTIGALNFD